MDVLKKRKIIYRATLVTPKGMKKCSFISIGYDVYILVRNENITSEEQKHLKQSFMQSEL